MIPAAEIRFKTMGWADPFFSSLKGLVLAAEADEKFYSLEWSVV